MNLNPIVDNFIFEMSDDFFKLDSVKKYSNFLYLNNGPIKDFQTHFYESVINIVVPGLTASPITVTNLGNLRGVGTNQKLGTVSNNMTETSINRSYIGTAPLDEQFNSKQINLTLKNTYINWAYCYEYYRSYFQRDRSVNDFVIFQTMLNAANIPMFQFIYSDCFISQIPDLEFSTNSQIRDMRTIDIGITFNKFDVKFILPEYNTEIDNDIIL